MIYIIFLNILLISVLFINRLKMIEKSLKQIKYFEQIEHNYANFCNNNNSQKQPVPFPGFHQGHLDRSEPPESVALRRRRLGPAEPNGPSGRVRQPPVACGQPGHPGRAHRLHRWSGWTLRRLLHPRPARTLGAGRQTRQTGQARHARKPRRTWQPAQCTLRGQHPRSLVRFNIQLWFHWRLMKCRFNPYEL